MVIPRRLSATLLLVSAWLLAAQGWAQSAGVTPVGLTCEYLEDPPVIDVTQPRLSWVNEAPPGARGQIQTAYRVQVATSREGLLAGEADLWDSARVESDQSLRVRYAGRPLVSRQDCWWRVRVWDRDGRASDWSAPASWSMGLLDPSEWRAEWIGAPWEGEEPLPDPPRGRAGDAADPPPPRAWPPPAPLLRKAFALEREVRSARVYVTGLGFFELYLNGDKVGDDVLVPNLTLYGKRPGLGNNTIALPDDFREYRVMYLAYDVTARLRRGENVLGAILGNGFFNAPSYWTESYGTPRFLAQMHVTYVDGSEEVVVSDATWKASESPIVMDLVYDGEDYDARLEQPGWSAPGFDDSDWQPVARRRAPEGRMKAHMSPTDRVMEVLEPVEIERLGEGRYRVDFGEEISGWLRLSGVRGEAGHRIDVKYISESPVGDNSYTLRGGGEESYATRFSWYVFREVEISNWPGELRADQLRAEAVYSNVESTGHFASSNPLFDAIHRIWRRSQTDNMHGGIASDCPHRERSPYTGDGQVACVTVMHNYDAASFYTKWIQDILGSQVRETGYVPNCAPWQPGCGGGVGWGVAVHVMPWEFYLHYGDRDILEYAYPGMQGYIRYMLTWTGEDGVMHSQRPGNDGQPLRWFNLGDWAPSHELPPEEMVHTFYLWRGAELTARTAALLGEAAESAEYAALAERTRQAFWKRFFDEGAGSYGPYGGDVFALRMGVPDSQRPRVIEALRRRIQADDGHLDTGIFGTRFFFEVLSENGLHELAFEAMNKRTFPSYGWWIEQGATTTWEQWSGDGSRNHPMFGGGIVWLYRKLAGMSADPEAPGYRHIVFRPEPVADVEFAEYSNRTPFGTAGIRWERRDGRFSMEITVPVGSTATVFVPTDDPGAVTESGEPVTDGPHLSSLGARDGYAVFSAASGRYSFAASLRAAAMSGSAYRLAPASEAGPWAVDRAAGLTAKR